MERIWNHKTWIGVRALSCSSYANLGLAGQFPQRWGWTWGFSQEIRSNVKTIPLSDMTRKGNFMEIERRLVVSWGWGWEWGLTITGHEGSSWGKENVLNWTVHNSVNWLTIIPVCIWPGWIFWYVSYISVKLFFQIVTGRKTRRGGLCKPRYRARKPTPCTK